jgi:hypothetical protein
VHKWSFTASKAAAATSPCSTSVNLKVKVGSEIGTFAFNANLKQSSGEASFLMLAIGWVGGWMKFKYQNDSAESRSYAKKYASLLSLLITGQGCADFPMLFVVYEVSSKINNTVVEGRRRTGGWAAYTDEIQRGSLVGYFKGRVVAMNVEEVDDPDEGLADAEIAMEREGVLVSD